MKRLITATTLTLAIVSLAPIAQAFGSLRDAKFPHLGNGNASPNNARAISATHHFEVHIQGKALSALLIDLPEGVSIPKEIAVKNQSGEKINAKVSVNNRTATIEFAQAVPLETTLLINLRGVKTSRYGKTWIYQVYGKMVGLTSEIALGPAWVRTYDH
ncbi:MAG: DUF2808 domain-containing protein [Coleofasciculaceae cyanobacterium]